MLLYINEQKSCLSRLLLNRYANILDAYVLGFPTEIFHSFVDKNSRASRSH